MKVYEIRGGTPATLRVKPTSGSFQPLPARESEILLTRSDDQILIAFENKVWPIEGITPADNTEIIDVIGSGLPLVAYIAQARAGELVIETRRFTQEFRLPDPMQFGLDDKVMDDVRRGHKFSGTAADVAAWLEDQLFLPPSFGESVEQRRFIVSGDARGRLDAFRVHGFKVAADVKRVNDKLQIERVVRGGLVNNTRLMLVYAPASIVDATLAAELHGAVRVTLSEIVSNKESYLRIWQDYHKLERESVLRRARNFGSLEYHACEQRRDGGWRFHIAPIEDLVERLALLREWDRFELEAGEYSLEENLSASNSKSFSKRRRLSASVIGHDGAKFIVDLVGADEDDEQPKPPKSGFLYLSTSGDEVRLHRRERAEEALRTGNCPMPQIGLLMEGRPAPAARRARINVNGPKLRPIIREVFGSIGPTQRQREAIELALNTPDVCLIQGPPGTGKTKVITAIEQCLAVLAEEGIEPSHRILVCAAQHDAVENVVQRTEVFGLPAVKVGLRRRGSDTNIDPAQAFVDERVDSLRSRLQTLTEAERLSQARNIVLTCIRTHSLPSEQALRIRDLVRVLDDLLPPNLRDKALHRVEAFERPISYGEPEDTEKLLKAARGIRVEVSAFSDDGPHKARIALHRLDAWLTPEERVFLERCAAITESNARPTWLTEGNHLREAVIDRLTKPPPDIRACLDVETQQLLLDILDTVNRRLATARTGEDAAVSAYLHDLEMDPEGVRRALQHYTVVLASTLQQAAGNEMRRVLEIDKGQTTFESVIVDEAARANPLDLFIPLSMAKRRIVLVGDHRQLPHLLEPDVERQLAEGVKQGNVEEQMLNAVQSSLFERMWVILRKLEQADSNPRTKALNAQFRMHPKLGEYISREFYEIHNDDRLESPRPEIQFAHSLPGYMKDGVSCSAAWLNVPSEKGREVRGASKSRPSEARCIAKEVQRLLEHDSKLTFGVISPYSAQVDEIGRAMLSVGLTEQTNNARGWRIAEEWSTTYNTEGKKVERLRVGTVDAFQGKEFDVVFLSLTRSNDLPGESDEQQRRKFGHLMLENRLCVAMSRQKRLLVVVGDLAFVQAKDAQEPLRSLRAYVDLCGGLHGIIR